MKQVIINAAIITPMRIIPRGSIVIDGSRIEGIYEANAPVPIYGFEVIDAKGLYMSPGFIDTHVHGGGGFDFMDATFDDVAGACKAHMRYGTTTILPTSVACSEDELDAMLGACADVIENMDDGPNVPGVHLEGPYCSLEMAGAQNPEYIIDPDPEQYIRLLDKYHHIARWSSAPELPGGLELGRELARRGIHCAIAHSNAIWEEAREAYLNGYTHATHLYSGMSMTQRIAAYRHGGVVEAAFLLDGMTVEIIADGKHLPEELLRLIVKIKGYDKVMLVTDAMRAAAEADYPAAGRFSGFEAENSVNSSEDKVRWAKLGSAKSARDCIIEDGVAKTPDRQMFAGSIATTDRLVRTMVNLAEVPLREAVRMMTLTPATIMGYKSKGAIAEGMDADILLFDEDINIKAVFVGGALRFNRL